MATTHFDAVSANSFEIPSSSLFAGKATITVATTGITVAIPGATAADTAIVTGDMDIGAGPIIPCAVLTTDTLTITLQNADDGTATTGGVFYLVIKRT